MKFETLKQIVQELERGEFTDTKGHSLGMNKAFEALRVRAYSTQELFSKRLDTLSALGLELKGNAYIGKGSSKDFYVTMADVKFLSDGNWFRLMNKFEKELQKRNAA